MLLKLSTELVETAEQTTEPDHTITALPERVGTDSELTSDIVGLLLSRLIPGATVTVTAGILRATYRDTLPVHPDEIAHPEPLR